MNEKESSELLERINELEGTVENLRDLAAHAYIFCGVHDAPEKWLDVMFAGANGDDFTTEGLLPYTPPADPLVEWANRPLVYTSEVGEIKEFKIHTAQPQGDASPEQPRCECPHGDALEPLENHGLNCPVRVADPQARPDGGEVVAFVHHDLNEAPRLVWYSTAAMHNPPPSGTKLYTHPTSAPDVARLVELLNAIDADVLAAEQIGERVTHDDIRTCVSELRAAAQQESRHE